MQTTLYRDRSGRYSRRSQAESIILLLPVFTFIIFASQAILKACLDSLHKETPKVSQIVLPEVTTPKMTEHVVWYGPIPPIKLDRTLANTFYHAKFPKKYSASQIVVAKKIVEIAKKEKFDRVSLLLAISDCESSFNPKAINTKGNTPKWSVDRGGFMLNSYFYKHISDKCAFDLTCATKVAIQEINAGHQGRWMCNKIVKQDHRLPYYSVFLK